MFFEEGWAALADVTRDVVIRVQAFYAATGQMPDDADLLSEVALSVWEICEAASKVGVTSADGSLVPASKALVDWDDPRKLWNRHVDLRIGNVGSAPGGDTGPEALRGRYGPFLHLPLALPLNGVQSSMTFLDEELQDKPERDETTLKVAAAIAAAVAKGAPMTRELARKDLGANISRRKFKIAWALACDHSPELWTSLTDAV